MRVTQPLSLDVSILEVLKKNEKTNLIQALAGLWYLSSWVTFNAVCSVLTHWTQPGV